MPTRIPSGDRPPRSTFNDFISGVYTEADFSVDELIKIFLLEVVDRTDPTDLKFKTNTTIDEFTVENITVDLDASEDSVTVTGGAMEVYFEDLDNDSWTEITLPAGTHSVMLKNTKTCYVDYSHQTGGPGSPLPGATYDATNITAMASELVPVAGLSSIWVKASVSAADGYGVVCTFYKYPTEE